MTRNKNWRGSFVDCVEKIIKVDVNLTVEDMHSRVNMKKTRPLGRH
jgi:hypothetical protein